ncbi:MAG: 30S ribosomal protein S9 [Candidatus Taylorbacteria bacterium]|nr:30S ribosomal protein S9 [Candidatus Taylorbacteria bacterium]
MTESKSKYIEAVGRRKTSTARVRMTPGAKQSVTINDKPIAEYFKTNELQVVALEAFTKAGIEQKFAVSAHIVGGGISSQAQALRHGIARAIENYDKNLRGALKKEGFLTRDQRAKERRKFGLKKARKAPQWSKR